MRFSSARVKEAEEAVLNTLLWPKARGSGIWKRCGYGRANKCSSNNERGKAASANRASVPAGERP